jgi:hypothetical protein
LKFSEYAPVGPVEIVRTEFVDELLELEEDPLPQAARARARITSSESSAAPVLVLDLNIEDMELRNIVILLDKQIYL